MAGEVGAEWEGPRLPLLCRVVGSVPTSPGGRAVGCSCGRAANRLAFRAAVARVVGGRLAPSRELQGLAHASLRVERRSGRVEELGNSKVSAGGMSVR